MTPTILSEHAFCDLSGSVYLISSDGRMLSLPIPTRSTRDPLNWSTNKRARALLALIFFAVVGLVQVQGPSLMLNELAKEYSAEEMRPFHLDVLVSGPTLFMGVGAFLWIPLSLAVGRRPVFLVCNAIMVLAAAWAWVSGSFYQLLAAVCLQGLAESISTSAMLLMIIDITFIHQRPQAIAIFWSIGGAVALVALALVPMVADAGSSWRTFYMIWTIPSIISFFLAFLLCPETYFIRPAVAFDGHVLVQSATEKVKVYEDWEEVPGGKTLPDTPEKSKWREALKELRVWGGMNGGWKAMMTCYPQILMCICNPLIFWVALLNAVVFASMMSIGMTYVTLLSEEPYFFPLRITALLNLSGAVGALFAWPASGIMIAWICRYLAMRNGGVRDAEYYLPAFVLPILSGAASAILYGLAGERKWHWIWIYISYAFNAFSTVSLGTANTLWVTEAFPRWAAAALVVVGGGSYVTSFGMSFVILPWIKSQGFAGENIEIGVLILVVGTIAIPIAFWGKRLRQYIHSRWGMNEKGALRPQ